MGNEKKSEAGNVVVTHLETEIMARRFGATISHYRYSHEVKSSKSSRFTRRILTN
jgi:hypothetical protein